MMLQSRVTVPFVVINIFILLQIVHEGCYAVREPIYSCISNRRLADLPTHPGQIDNFESLFDNDKKIIAHRNTDSKLCFIQKAILRTNSSVAKTKSRCLSSTQLKLFAGNMIHDFCSGYKALLVGSAASLESSAKNSQSSEVIEDLSRARRNVGSLLNGTPPRGRYRGQTQSQYLNFNNNSTPPGRAEAESSPSGSRAVVSGINGMGQAQSQSGFSSGCEDCYGHPYDGLYKIPPRGQVGIGGKHYPETEVIDHSNGKHRPYGGYSPAVDSQTSGKYPNGKDDGGYSRGETVPGKYSQDPSKSYGTPTDSKLTTSQGGDSGRYLPTSTTGQSEIRQPIGSDQDWRPSYSDTGLKPGYEKVDFYQGRPQYTGEYQPPGVQSIHKQPTVGGGTHQTIPGSYQSGVDGRQTPPGPYQTGSTSYHVPSGYQGGTQQQPQSTYQGGAQQYPHSLQHGYQQFSQGHPSGSYQGSGQIPADTYVRGQQVPQGSLSGDQQQSQGIQTRPQSTHQGGSQIVPGSYAGGGNGQQSVIHQTSPGAYAGGSQTPQTTYQEGGVQRLPQQGHYGVVQQVPQDLHQSGIPHPAQTTYQGTPSGNAQLSSGSYPGSTHQVPSGVYPDTSQQTPQGSYPGVQQTHPGGFVPAVYPSGVQQSPQGTYLNGNQRIPSGNFQGLPQQRPSGSYPTSNQQITTGTLQGGNQQLPSGSYPGGSQQLPSGSYPGGSQQLPSGTYPGGSQQLPSGSYPGGSQQLPSGSYPSGSQQLPSGTYPSGSQQLPSGTYPSGSQQIPSGTYPGGSQHLPSGSYPGGSQQLPPGSYPGRSQQIPTASIQSGSQQLPSGSYPGGNQQPPSGNYPDGSQQLPSGSYPGGSQQIHSGSYPGGDQQLPSGSYPGGNQHLPSGSYPGGSQQMPTGTVQGGSQQLPSGSYPGGSQQLPSGSYPGGSQQLPSGSYPGGNQQLPSGSYPGGTQQLPPGSHQGGFQQVPHGVHYGAEIHPGGATQLPQGQYQGGPSQQTPSGTYLTSPGYQQGAKEGQQLTPSALYQGGTIDGGQQTPGLYTPGVQQGFDKSQSYLPYGKDHMRGQEGIYPPSQSRVSQQWDGQSPAVNQYNIDQHGSRGINGSLESTDEHDDSDSLAETAITQLENGTFASSSASGTHGGGSAQTQVSGTYSGTGAFSAQAQTIEANRGAQSQINAGDKGISSSAQGRGGRGQSQVQMQLGPEMGETIANAQTSGVNHGTNTQVKASSKGGLADAQASGPGSTSSQAQIGFLPQDSDYEDNKSKRLFYGGGQVSAQSGKYQGQSQAQIQGRFKYGISYNGAAQAGSGLKDGNVGNGTILKPLNLFGNTLRIDRDTTAKPQRVNTTEEPLKEVFEGSESKFYDNVQLPLENGRSETQHNKLTNYSDSMDYASSYSMDQKQISPIKGDVVDTYDTSMKVVPNAGDYEDSEEDDYDGEFYQSTEATHQELNRPREVVIQQTGGGQKQHILLGSVNTNGVHIVKDSSSRNIKEGMVFQPGEEIPGTHGYTIPIGFRGRVSSVSAGDGTYAYADENGESQAQTVTLTPGNGNITYEEPRHKNRNSVRSWNSSKTRNNAKVNNNNLRSNVRSDNPNNYVTVTKSITGQLNEDQTGLVEDKKFSHTYFTKSSTCGYFTFTCNLVYGSNGRTRICKPKVPTNPDGSPINC